MSTPLPARQAAYEAAHRALDAWIHRQDDIDNLWQDSDKSARVVVDAVWALGVEEGRRQSRALDPEVAEVVADTIERWEKR